MYIVIIMIMTAMNITIIIIIIIIIITILIISLPEDSHYKFLGVMENTKQDDDLSLQIAGKAYLQRLSLIWSSPLSDHT